MAQAVYAYRRDGRSLRGAVVVAAVWLVLAALLVFLDAAVWLVGALALATVPAVWDLIRNPASGLTLEADRLCWHSGPQTAVVALAEVDHIRLDTRLDFSVRATVVLQTGRKIRIPFEATPPHQAYEQVLTDAAVTVKRFHFQLLQ